MRRKLAPNRRLLVIVLLTSKDEVVVGNRCLPRVNRVPAGDLIERVNRERGRAIRRRQQIGVDPERVAWLDVRVFVNPMRPDDLLGRGHATGPFGVGKLHERLPGHRRLELSTTNRKDAAASSNLVFLGGQRHRLVPLASSNVLEAPRDGVEAELVAIARIAHCLGTLDDVQAEVEGVATKNVAHVVGADDHHLEPDFLGDRLEPGGRHLSRRANRKAIAGDHKRLAGVNALAKVRHQIAERAGLPPLVERVETL